VSEPVRRLGVAFNPTSEASLALRERAIEWCTDNGMTCEPATAADRAALKNAVNGSQALVVLGGDGTFLRAVQGVFAEPADVPVLGVNSGKVGFLSQVEAESLEATLALLRAGAYALEPRMACQATIHPAGGPPGAPLVALNEAAVVRGAQPSVVRLDVAIGSSHLATYIADGLLVATPTGSTGYSFSAGGPILDPVSRNLVVTAVAAYLAAIRSVVVSPDHTVTMRILDGAAQLSIDGHDNVPLAVGDTIEVTARERPISFVVPDGALPFWDLLRHKAELLPS
jgi:NAD+ kinase